jgi:proteasome accessory factor C
LFQKHWSIVRALQGRVRGLSRQKLIETTGIPSTTLHRCVTELRDMGVPIATRTCNGEAWHSLEADELPALTLTSTQLMALRVARRMVGSIEGSLIAKELDALLAPHKLRDADKASVSVGRSEVVDPAIVDALDRAITQRRRVRIRGYTRAKPEMHDRLLDPLGLRCAGGTTYLVAFDRDKQAYRLFKVARVSSAQKLADQADAHPDFDEQAFFKDAIKVGSGAALEIELRFSAAVAKIVREYPALPSQTLTDHADGSVTLRARTAGVQETLRWVLGWGRDAQVVGPIELRDAVAEELTAAAQQYEPRPKRAKERSLIGLRAQGFPRIADRG